MQNHRMVSKVRFVVALAWVSYVSIGWSGFGIQSALGQLRNRMQPNQSFERTTLMQAPREVIVLLEEAENEIKNEQWSEATLALGILLGLEESRQDDLAGLDFFLSDELANDAAIIRNLTKVPKRSVFQRVYELIESLPSEATKFIDLRYGVQASQFLEAGIAASDWSRLSEVAGRFGFTSAGQDASLILGEHWLRHGDPRRAARQLSRVVRQKSALERLGPAVGVLTASAYQAAGMPAEALASLDSVRSTFADADLNWRGTRVRWDRSSLSKDILPQIAQPESQMAERVIKQPYFMGGNAMRNADTNAGIPLPNLRWHAELHESTQHKLNLERTLKEKLAEGKSTLIPSRVPISVGQWVITSTYDQRIVAIDSQTGVLGWECVYSGMPLGFSMDRFAGRDSHSLSLPAPDYLTKRVWGESMVGTLSSDGERIFSIGELPAIDVSESFAMGMNARVSKPQGSRSYNVMQCWSIREEGKIKWEVGGQKSLTEPKLAGTLFLGSPLPHESELLVLGELNSDLYLFALAPDSGKLLWRQPLTTNQEGAIASDPMRRSVGAMPAADGSIVVCPTLSGYLVAVDSSSHSMKWAYRYPVRTDSASTQFNQWGQAEPGEFSPLLSRSVDTSAVIHDGVVLFAPADGEDVFGIHVENGNLVWKTNYSKGEQVRYVGGAWRDTAIIVCQTSLRGLDLKSGTALWPAIEFPNGHQVAGRGVRKGKLYLVPTTNREILHIDLESGKIVDSVRVDQPVGNLVSVGDRVICATPFELDCYSVREAIQSQLKEELQRDSVSPGRFVRQAELALSKSDFDSALNFLAQASKLDPNNAEVVFLSTKAGIEALSSDFEKYVDSISLSKNLVLDRDRILYLRLLIHGFQKQGRYVQAMETLIELSNLRVSQRQEQMAGSVTMVISPQWSIREDRWIATQTRNVVEKLSANDWQLLKPRLAALLVSIGKLPSNVRRLQLEHFESVRETEELRLESAKNLVEQKDFLQAERMLKSDGFLDSADPNSPNAMARRTVLAVIYAVTKRFDLAAVYLNGDIKRLNQIIKEDTISDPSQTEATATAATAASKIDPSLLGGSKSLAQWPRGKVRATISQIESQPLHSTESLDSSTLCRWKNKIGDALTGWEVHFAGSTWTFSNPVGGGRMEIYADAGSQEKTAAPNVFAVDSIAILELNRQIIAVDTLRAAMKEEGLLWREQFDFEAVETGRMKAPVERIQWGLPSNKGSFRVVAVSRAGVLVLIDNELACLDLSSGVKQWTRTGYKGCTFATNANELLVCNPTEASIQHMDIRDGSLLSTVPFKQEGWTAVAAVGDHWLMAPESPRKYAARLIDGKTGRVVFERELSASAKLAIDGDTGIVVLRPISSVEKTELTYWSIPLNKEFVHEIEADASCAFVNLQRFGDTLLVCPYNVGLEIDSVTVSPGKTDPSFAPIAGPLIAISTKDGSQVWKKCPLMSQFFLPLPQDRNSPAVVFVRRLSLSKVQGKKVEMMSMAVLDVRDGRVVFSADNLPSTQGLGFAQTVLVGQNRVLSDYLGTRVDLAWTEEAEEESPSYELEALDVAKLKKQAEARIREQMAPANATDASEPNRSK